MNSSLHKYASFNPSIPFIAPLGTPDYFQRMLPCLDSYCLTLSTLGKLFQQTTFGNIFLIFHRKQDLTFHANCLLMTICMKYQILFPGKNRKISSICLLLKNAQRMVEVTPTILQFHYNCIGKN